MMDSVFQTDSLEAFKEYHDIFKNFSTSYPETTCSYIWNSSKDPIDMYFTKEELVSPEGDIDDFLRTVDIDSFGGLTCFPQSKSIVAVDKQALANSLTKKLNTLSNQSGLYTYNILPNTINQDTTKNRAVSYLSSFPILNIIEASASRHSFLHIHFCEEQNAILFALSCEVGSTFALIKQDIIDTLCEAFHAF